MGRWKSLKKRFVIDLDRPAEQRWDEVIAGSLPAAKLLAEEAMSQVEEGWIASSWFRGVRRMFGELYRRMDRTYAAEIGSWADALGLKFYQMLELQFSYELMHASEWTAFKRGQPYGGGHMGCTVGMVWLPGLGATHVRNLDWPLEQIGQATRIFRYVKGNHYADTVGMAGFVGVLSGMVPNCYSATINWAPPTKLPGFRKPASFLLRETLTEERDFVRAIKRLQTTPISSSVLYAVCGREPGHARVIERTADKYEVRGVVPADEAVCVANHFETNPLKGFNRIIDESGATEDSLVREKQMQVVLQRLREHSSKHELDGNANVEVIEPVTRVEPIINDFTQQRMAFEVRSGKTRVEAWVDD